MSRITGDFLKFLSITAVVAIHATHDKEVFFNQYHDVFSSSFFGALLNQISRFSVPVFVLLSGYGLTKKYGQTPPGEIDFPWAMAFYKKRYFKIGLPFFFWTVILLVLFKRFDFTGSLYEILWLNALILLKYLFVQGADYHFYFFTIILECYLLYPLLLKFRSAPVFLFITFIHLMHAFPVAIYDLTGIALYRFPSSFSVYWLLYFYIGIISADARAEERIKSIPPVSLIVLTLAALSHVIFEYVRRSFVEENPDYYNHFNRFSVLMYSLLLWASFMRVDSNIHKFIKTFKLTKITILLSCLSFGVYIYHPMLLRMVNYIFPGGSLFVVPAVILGSFIFMMILDWLVRINLLRIVIGLPERLPERPYFFGN